MPDALVLRKSVDFASRIAAAVRFVGKTKDEEDGALARKPIDQMPNDAKLGLVLGVAVVLTIAAVYFRRDAPPVPVTNSTAAVRNPAIPPMPAGESSPRP
jgi:hypothetical protein